MAHAVVMGEALVDLLETGTGDERTYRPVLGGAPFNVAVGVARLGGHAEFVGSLGDDVWADRAERFLAAAGVGVGGVRRSGTATTLAMTTFTGAEPQFRFYGEPPSYALLEQADLDTDLVAGAAVLYTGSISLLREPFRGTAVRAWTTPGPLKVFDPNVRPSLLPDTAAVDRLRRLAEEFAATADLVKLSSADVAVLYGGATVAQAAARLRTIGARAVVVTQGPHGAWLDGPAGVAQIPAPVVAAIDATGAGDSVMAALIHRWLTAGPPGGPARWKADLAFALAVAALVCERPGGAVAMPTLDELRSRWGELP
ncbi:carbohydrate kinase [Actinoplanes ianthinogenes]|uniref:Carbohydrate kinase n=1 Tax=Actinoplanes ianthinogenes TaxID=122358 RepID=A0ABM7M7G0_9ACTN|nr:PfkB family carbohydrate kinase [Actinoplanes ianthinogenes]BCJ47566.1 carbohydrate kinase [Actinoplanes ianthinogenes]GGR02650.1 carbohydrate kinase [Actinoplanes ianthinogenes]